MGVRENIIRLRKLTGISQEELGKIAGVSRSAVSLWEIGNSEPRMGAVQSIADHYGLRKANIIEDGGMDRVAVSITGRLYEPTDDTVAMSADERELIRLFRSCDQRGREYMMQMAEVTATLYDKGFVLGCASSVFMCGYSCDMCGKSAVVRTLGTRLGRKKAPPRTQRRGAYLALLFYFQPLYVKAVGAYRVDGAVLA